MNKADYSKQKGDDRFYVYIHRRLSDNKPFYVGKGCQDRAWKKSNRNKFWKHVVDKHGYVVEILFDSLNEQEAFQVEIDTILEFEYFGYPLTNLSKGGEGPSGFTQSEETKILKSSIGKSRETEFREYGKKQWAGYSEDERKIRLEHLDNVRNNEKARAKLSIIAKERWSDPEYKKKLSTIMKESQKLVSNLHSNNMKDKWSDPEYRSWMIECRRVARSRKLAIANSTE